MAAVVLERHVLPGHDAHLVVQAQLRIRAERAQVRNRRLWILRRKYGIGTIRAAGRSKNQNEVTVARALGASACDSVVSAIVKVCE